MLGAIRRVISGEDFEETQKKDPFPAQLDATSTPPSNASEFDSNPVTRMESPPPAAVVETDDDNDGVQNNEGGNDDNSNVNSTMDVDVHRDGDNSIAGSSLSDVSAAKDPSFPRHISTAAGPQPMRMVVEEAPRPPIPPAGMPTLPHYKLPRNDSRNSNDSFSSYGRQSSQNSSRDWGWFDDVHTTSSDHPANVGGGGGRNASAGNLKRSKDHFNAGSPNENHHNGGGHNNKKGKRGGGDDDDVNIRSGGRAGERPGGISSYGGTPLFPNLELLAGGREFGGFGAHTYDQPLERLILQHPATAMDMESEAAVQAMTAPPDVLEASLSTQWLWKHTAGNRPPQPLDERAFYEKMWAQNFARSQVEYQMPVDVLTATTPISLSPFADGCFDAPSAVGTEISNYNLAVVPPTSDGQSCVGGGGIGGGGGGKNQANVAEATLVSRLNDPSQHRGVASGMSGAARGQGNFQNHGIINRKVDGRDGQMTVLIKGDNVFGTTVSKSFVRHSMNGGPIAGVDTVNISVASYRVVESKKHGKYAQFLVIYREGSIRDTIGVWKRYSDFQELSKKVTKAHEGCSVIIANMSPLAVTDEHDVEHLPNAITSWQLLKKRQRWYRCLDAGYLSLKVFLLERFLHDILFESSSPTLLREFVGVPPPRA